MALARCLDRQTPSLGTLQPIAPASDSHYDIQNSTLSMSANKRWEFFVRVNRFCILKTLKIWTVPHSWVKQKIVMFDIQTYGSAAHFQSFI